MMPDSVFWRDLREQFAQLNPSGKLRPDGSNPYVYSTLEMLMVRGASAIAPANTGDLFGFWYGELKKEGLGFQLWAQSTTAMTESEYAWQLEAGTIESICEASATLCARLENRAIQGEFARKPSTAEQHGASPAAVEDRRMHYRSELKRFIQLLLLKNPGASNLDICRALDADGVVDLPERWKNKPDDRLFARAFSNDRLRNKIEVLISKVRKDLRKVGMLPPLP